MVGTPGRATKPEANSSGWRNSKYHSPQIRAMDPDCFQCARRSQRCCRIQKRCNEESSRARMAERESVPCLRRCDQADSHKCVAKDRDVVSETINCGVTDASYF